MTLYNLCTFLFLKKIFFFSNMSVVIYVVIYESMTRKILLKYFDYILKIKPIENSILLNNFRQCFSQEDKFKLMFIKDNIIISFCFCSNF